MKIYKINIIVLITFLILIFQSCGILFYRKIECREFENIEDLRWFPGKIADTITFYKQDNTIVKFEISDKYILHMKQYISDTGCGCFDRWGILLTNKKDTISMFSDAKYVYNNKPNRYDKFYIKTNNILSGFITEDKDTLEFISINGNKIYNITKFRYDHTDSLKFKSVYIAKDIGIVKLERVNGEIWINKDLMKKDTSYTNISSFDFSEQYCN